ncbi:MAG: hypothetical protein HYW22_01805 [Candidatus Aenigmarchaeota archaeon]|nr:hypothetical protein [Candidatus Aenigmarchaeota archaeon]
MPEPERSYSAGSWVLTLEPSDDSTFDIDSTARYEWVYLNNTKRPSRMLRLEYLPRGCVPFSIGPLLGITGHSQMRSRVEASLYEMVLKDLQAGELESGEDSLEVSYGFRLVEEGTLEDIRGYLALSDISLPKEADDKLKELSQYLEPDEDELEPIGPDEIPF